jgi:hypothetical protein
MAPPFAGRARGIGQRIVARREGAVAQLGEHLLCKQGVVGSIPSSSTSRSGWVGVGRGHS